MIVKLASSLETDLDELLLARKIPPNIKRRVLERPDAFRKLAAFGDKTLNRVLAKIGLLEGEGVGHKNKARRIRQ
jgi:hypothetical protein